MYFLHYLDVLIVPLAVAYLMMLAGVGKNALAWKRSGRCPSCGRDVRRCRCRE